MIHSKFHRTNADQQFSSNVLFSVPFSFFSYVKGTYLESLNRMAPSYLVEKYAGIAPYLAEDHLQQGTCPVDIEFSPFHSERPGLSIYYSYKKLWKHISKVEDIYAIIVENDVVKLEMRDNPAGFAIQISDPQKLESFVSCVAGYYRFEIQCVF